MAAGTLRIIMDQIPKSDASYWCKPLANAWIAPDL